MEARLSKLTAWFGILVSALPIHELLGTQESKCINAIVDLNLPGDYVGSSPSPDSAKFNPVFDSIREWLSGKPGEKQLPSIEVFKKLFDRDPLFAFASSRLTIWDEEEWLPLRELTENINSRAKNDSILIRAVRENRLELVKLIFKNLKESPRFQEELKEIRAFDTSEKLTDQLTTIYEIAIEYRFPELLQHIQEQRFPVEIKFIQFMGTAFNLENLEAFKAIWKFAEKNNLHKNEGRSLTHFFSSSSSGFHPWFDSAESLKNKIEILKYLESISLESFIPYQPDNPKSGTWEFERDILNPTARMGRPADLGIWIYKAALRHGYSLKKASTSDLYVLASLKFEEWDQVRNAGKTIDLKEAIELRDALLTAFTTKRNPDLLYHHLVHLRDYPFTQPILTAQIVNRAQEYLHSINYHRKNSEIIPFSYGSMLLGSYGYVHSSRTPEVIRKYFPQLNEYELSDHETGLSGYELQSLKYSNTSVPERISTGFNVWKLKEPFSLGTIKIKLPNNSEREFEKYGIAKGGGVAFYRDKKTGLLFSICIDGISTTIDRISWAYESITTFLSNKFEEENLGGKIPDLVALTELKLLELDPELRQEVSIRLIKSPVLKDRIGKLDQKRLTSLKNSPTWKDLEIQLKLIRQNIEKYQRIDFDEAAKDFEKDEKTSLGFKTISSRGLSLIISWLEKGGVEFPKYLSNEDKLAHLRALQSITVVDGYFSLPYQQALLLAFREGPFSHTDPNKSHLEALKHMAVEIQNWESKNKVQIKVLSIEEAERLLKEAIAEVDKDVK